MRSKFWDLLYQETRNVPNKFTVAVGELIRKARLEANKSQEQLADEAYLKQSSISKLEAGTRSMSMEDLLYLSYSLEKPIGYFFPERYTRELGFKENQVLQEELLMQARRLERDDLKKLIAQARALAEYEE